MAHTKNHDAYAFATQPSGECCSSDAPKPDVVASVTIRVSRFWSKCLLCVISETIFLIFSNDLLSSGFQLVGLFVSVFLTVAVMLLLFVLSLEYIW